MSNAQEFSEAPWRVSYFSDDDPYTRLVDEDGQTVCDFCGSDYNSDRNAANASLIVRAVNCHDDLVTACKELIDWHGWRRVPERITTQIEAALARVEVYSE